MNRWSARAAGTAVRRTRAPWLSSGCAILAACGLASMPERALACTQERVPTAQVFWPHDGATDVPTDTPIAVSVSGPSAPWTYSLAAAGRPPVELHQARVLTGDPWQTTLLGPRAPLDPSTPYHFRATLEGVDASAIRPGLATFTTGTRTRGTAPPPRVDLVLLRLEPDGGSFLELFATTPGVEPAWILATGMRAGSPETQLRMIGNDPYSADLQLGAVACTDVELVDVTGATLRAETLCKPDQCTRRGDINSCSGNPHASLPGVPCAAMPPARATDEGSSAGCGCSLAPGSDQPAGPKGLPWLLLLAAFARIRRARSLPR